MKKSVLLGSAVLVLCVMLTNAYAAISSQERAALIALYNSTNGDSWDNNSGWKEPPLAEDGFAMPGTENGWYGVGCDAGNTTVNSIIFVANQLTGAIPPELGDLANLQRLGLVGGQLTGAIPPELGDLANLQSLGLVANQLTGAIPPELGDLANLLDLSLSYNQLTGPIPVELMNLTSLLDNESNFCDNYLYTSNTSLRDFLNTKQRGADWESCQNSVDLPSYAGAFGSIISETNYNRFCDVDRDGDVDGNDFGKFAEVIWDIIAD